MFKSDQIDQLATALAKAQGDLVSAKKESKGHGYTYSDLSTVIESIKAVFPKNNLSYSQLVGNSTEGTASVTTIIMHASGQYIGQEASIRVPEMRGINETQKVGAALSYLRRYTLQALSGMASEDSDASSSKEVAEVPKVATPVKAASAPAASAPAPSTDFSNRARQLRRTNGEQPTTERNESF